ncbi:hypothetical protein [Ureibacillus sinduriensis]|uniref:hypothetical protein n=1 Tax=Ureibacillus sinduriensis TaxID=561440 RepID=UPI00068E5816|nr:hypothetical protein [Ureibacillus sinduriensis]
MLAIEKGRLVLVVLVLGLFLFFINSSNTFASNSYDEIDVEEKIVLYKLNNIVDLLKSGDNEITYHWTDLDGINRSVDLVISVNNNQILSVEEKNISSDEELNTIKNSINKKDPRISILSTEYPQVSYKLNGGMTSSQFVNTHAFNRHKYEQGASSSCSRTRYARDVGVKAIRESTVAQYDEKYSTSSPATTVYIKRYRTASLLSMQITENNNRYTPYHRVINNYSDPTLSTHHPLCV